MAKVCAEQFTIIDTAQVFYMGDILGINIPFLRRYEGRPGEDYAPPTTVKGPPSVPAPKEPESQSTPLDSWPTLQAEEAAPQAQPKRIIFTEHAQEVEGNDALGGRIWDAPADLHEEMLAKLSEGRVPCTSISQRRSYTRCRPTFYGPVEFKAAVRHGYLHPKVQAPAGYTWKELTTGWKLVPTSMEQTPLPSIEDVLRTAQPQWNGEEVEAEAAKLARIRLQSTTEVVQWLRKRGTESLNGRLALAGAEPLRSETLSALTNLME